MPTLDPDPALQAAPLVSVCMTAYNSAAWLPRSIHSVLQQKTAFRFEIVISDDCSADGTIDVLRSLQEQHPAILRVLQRAERVGMQRNYFDAFEHCRGKYTAWLDADDYWTDPDKLNAQVAVLERDSSIAACGHFVRQVTATGDLVRRQVPDMPAGRYGLADIIAENFIPSPSIMFRSGLHKSLPASFFELRGLVDWPILLQAALGGEIALLEGVMAAYVLTPGSAYMSKGPLYQDAIDLEFYKEMRRMLPGKWERSIRKAEGKRYEAMAHHLAKAGSWQEARNAARQALRLPDVMDNFVSKIKAAVSVEGYLALSRYRSKF